MTIESPLHVPHGLCLPWHAPSPVHPTISWLFLSTWLRGVPSGPWGCSALSNLLSFLTPHPTSALGVPRGGTTMPLAVTDGIRTGHRTQARPIRLGFSQRAPGQFLLVGLMEPGRWPRLGVKGQEGARQGWKESQGIMGKRQNQRPLNLAFKTLIPLAQPHPRFANTPKLLELLGCSVLFLASAIWHLLLVLFFLGCLSCNSSTWQAPTHPSKPRVEASSLPFSNPCRANHLLFSIASELSNSLHLCPYPLNCNLFII